MNKLTKKQIEIIERDTAWCVKEYEDYYYFSWYTDAGEDFGFEINKDEDIIKAVEEYYEDFEPGEHATMWYGANRGEPSSLDVLLEDAKKIEENLKILVRVLNGGCAKKYYDMAIYDNQNNVIFRAEVEAFDIESAREMIWELMEQEFYADLNTK